MARRMNEDDERKDFLAVKGRLTFHITPQTPRGWITGGLWTLALILPHVGFATWAKTLADTPDEIWITYGLVPLFTLTGLTIWAMIRWMLTRSEVVSPQEIRDAARKKASRTDRKQD